MFSHRIRLRPLAQLCHRLSIATGAGLQDLKIWQDESRRGSASQQRMVGRVAQALAQGSTLAESVASTGSYFPRLFRQMLEVGEVSGQLSQTYERLAQHYDASLAAKKVFLSKLSWPAFQLGMALAVIGILIWVMGVLPAGAPDLLGLGLIGNRGLMLYLNGLILCGLGGWLLIEATRRGAFWLRPVQRWLLSLPLVGQAWQTLALARFTWSLQLVLDTSMDLRAALPLVLDATGNDHYARWGPDVARRIQQGQEIHVALGATGVFPPELLDQIAVGEHSGRLAEIMRRLAEEYQERASTATAVLAQVAGYAIWLLISGFIIMLIFRLFSVYVAALNEAAQPI